MIYRICIFPPHRAFLSNMVKKTIRMHCYSLVLLEPITDPSAIQPQSERETSRINDWGAASGRPTTGAATTRIWRVLLMTGQEKTGKTNGGFADAMQILSRPVFSPPFVTDSAGRHCANLGEAHRYLVDIPCCSVSPVFQFNCSNHILCCSKYGLPFAHLNGLAKNC